MIAVVDKNRDLFSVQLNQVQKTSDNPVVENSVQSLQPIQEVQPVNPAALGHPTPSSILLLPDLPATWERCLQSWETNLSLLTT